MEDITSYCATPEEAWAWLEGRGITHAPQKPPVRQTRTARKENQGPNKHSSTSGPLKEQAATERVWAGAEVEIQTGTPSPPPPSDEQLDVDIPDMDSEQIHVLIAGGPPRSSAVRGVTTGPEISGDVGRLCGDPTESESVVPYSRLCFRSQSGRVVMLVFRDWALMFVRGLKLPVRLGAYGIQGCIRGCVLRCP
ncbi:hypothetical protein NDU88_003705 [Pleurodeles waltl]|uniref:Uncharacterized protein n=1 Tax=Pleurodeles waltl TaxID=8319 RepID=A0AAV7NIZ2_PLEWA|nr:hypothetical protein NDU88_003705 [Pleurodeles waltl]